jgi:GNAT superfamily N-acetyltransferase
MPDPYPAVNLMKIRLIRPSDAPAYRSIVERTSDDDRYNRFFHSVDALDPADVRRAVERRPDMIGAIAFDDGDDGVALGAGHAALLDDASAELAIVVAAEARRRGVARELLLRLMAELEKRGYMRFVAYSLHGNHGFAQLARSVGLVSERVDGGLVHWARDVVPRESLVRIPNAHIARSSQ